MGATSREQEIDMGDDAARALGVLVRRKEWLTERLREHRSAPPLDDRRAQDRREKAQRMDAEEIAALAVAAKVLRLNHAELADEDRASTVLRDAVTQLQVLLAEAVGLTPTQRVEAQAVLERGQAVLKLID